MPPTDGALQLKALGVKLKVLGAVNNLGPAESLGAGRSLRAQLLAGIRTAAQPAVEAARTAARDQLPKHGGLNEYVANSQIVTSARTAGSQVGVRIGVKKGSKAAKAYGANKGLIRHPVFKTGRWVDQELSSKGWFDDTMRREGEKTIVPISAVMRAVAEEITRRV